MSGACSTGTPPRLLVATLLARPERAAGPGPAGASDDAAHLQRRRPPRQWLRGTPRPRSDRARAELVRAMNSLGIVVDLSCVGRATALEAIRRSREPVIFRHSNAAALVGHPSNLSDETIRAFRDSCGVIGVTASGPFCSSGSGPAATLSDYLTMSSTCWGSPGPTTGESAQTSVRTPRCCRSLPRTRSILEMDWSAESTLGPNDRFGRIRAARPDRRPGPGAGRARI
jgi:hypothetical protein